VGDPPGASVDEVRGHAQQPQRQRGQDHDTDGDPRDLGAGEPAVLERARVVAEQLEQGLRHGQAAQPGHHEQPVDGRAAP